MTMTFGSLFSGIGAAEYAALSLNDSFELRFACENDPWVKKTFLANHQVKTFFDDVLTIRELPHVDVIVFGPPCQAFSFAGRREGTLDVRGQLCLRAAKLVRKSRPRFFILENVKGLLSIQGG